jgi:hypothetical protein
MVVVATNFGGSGAPLQVSLNAAASVFASSGACPAQPTVRELAVPALAAPLGGMRGLCQWPQRLACACSWRGYRLAPPFFFPGCPHSGAYGYVCSGADWSSGPWYVITLTFK